MPSTSVLILKRCELISRFSFPPHRFFSLFLELSFSALFFDFQWTCTARNGWNAFYWSAKRTSPCQFHQKNVKLVAIFDIFKSHIIEKKNFLMNCNSSFQKKCSYSGHRLERVFLMNNRVVHYSSKQSSYILPFRELINDGALRDC